MDDDNLPFSEVLDRLFSDGPVPVSPIYRLSDMMPEEMEQFEARWPEQPEERRRVIARHMADICEENFVVDFSPVFLRLLDDPSSDVRQAAVDGLWDTSNVAVISKVVAMMQRDEDLAVRAAAAACLGHFVLMAEWGQIDYAVGERVVAALSEIYEQPETVETVRRASLESLGSSADPRVVQYIEDAYGSGGDQLQMSAVFAMGRSADNRWTSTVIQEMDNPDWEMRLEAARAAGGIGSSDAADRLIELLDDDVFEVRLAAVGALGQIGSDQAYEALAMRLDDEQSYDLHDAIEDAIDEIEWLGGELDLSLLEWDDDGLSL
jgi:hypothetical protein